MKKTNEHCHKCAQQIKNRVRKLLDYDRIEELEAERIKQNQEKENEPKQITLFDWGLTT